MRLGVCTPGLPMPREEKFTLARRLGLAGVQMAPAEVAGANPEAAAQVREAARAHGLGITGTTAGPNLVDPVGLEERIQEFRDFFRLSVALGSGLVTGEVKAKPDGLSDEAAWESVLHAVRGVVRLADEQGGVFALEAGPGCWVRTAADVERVLTAVAHPRLKVNFDARNHYVAGDDPVEAARCFAGEIVHAHVNDGVRSGRDGRWEARPVGAGEMDHAAVLRTLEQLGFNGYLCVEHCRSAAELTSALAHLRAVYPFAGG